MTDSDLDAELLALAADSPDADGELADDAGPTFGDGSSSPAPQAEPARRSPSPGGQRGVATKKTTKSKTSRRQSAVSDLESEEDGEASSPAPSHNSLGSGEMSESDSDAGLDDLDAELGEKDKLLFPLEGKYLDEADKATMESLPEVTREAILAERAAEVDRRNQDLQLRRLLQRRKREEAEQAEKKKRKAAAADLEDGPRKSSRAKTKASESIESYKRQRELRNQQRRNDQDRRDRDRSRSRGASDRDADGDSDVEWDSGAPTTSREPEPELRDFERIRVGRSNFAKVCFYPGFGDAITGCFCRVNVGLDPVNGQNVYRMAQITGFSEGKPYRMDGPSGPFMTDQYAILTYGKSDKSWPFVSCSDSKFTEAEYQRWLRVCDAEGAKIPKHSYLLARCDGIHKLLNHSWTDAEISEKIRRQNKYDVHEHDKSSQARPVPNRTDRLAEINERNRKANAEEVRRALLQQRRRELAARDAAAAKAKAREAEQKALLDQEQRQKEGLLAPKDDLFGDGSDISRTGTPGARSGTSTPAPKKERKGLPGFARMKMDDEIIGELDLGIDVEI